MRSGFAVAALLLFAAAGVAQPPVSRSLPMRHRVALADCVVTGKVVELEKTPVDAASAPENPNKVRYTIANVKIEDALLGANGLTNVRVGFVPGGAAPGVATIRMPGGAAAMNPTVGQEGCFFLCKHPVGDFYTMTAMSYTLDRKSDSYAKDLELVVRAAKALADAPAALKSKDAKARLSAAGMLLMRYQAYRGTGKQEPIPAEESKLILTVIADADWSVIDPEAFVSPVWMFNRLGLEEKDGFTIPKIKPGEDFDLAMERTGKDWIKANVEKYRIRKYVPGK